MAAKKNQIVIDLGKIALTPVQRQKLQNEIHKTVAGQMGAIDAANSTSTPAKVGATPAAITANIQATFTNTNPGVSSLTATLNSTQKTLSQSGTVSFTGVQSGDIILVQVDSLGSATITIDVNATPAQMNFPPGSHSKNFIIN